MANNLSERVLHLHEHSPVRLEETVRQTGAVHSNEHVTVLSDLQLLWERHHSEIEKEVFGNNIKTDSD